MLSTFLNRLSEGQSGAIAIEYGLILSLIVIAMIGALQDVATTTINMSNDVDNKSTAVLTK